MTRYRDLLILLALFVVLVAFTILGPGQSQADAPDGRATTHSSAPEGVLALLRWTQAIGYDARRLEYTAFALDADTAALFIINPSLPINRTAAGEVLAWVANGGTLILIDDQSRIFGGGNAILTALDLEVVPHAGEPATIERATVLQPVLTTPPVQEVVVQTDRILTFERSDVARLLGTADSTVLVGIKHGAGYIYVTSASFPFTNQGLRAAQNAALVLNLLRSVPAGGRILFDEYHHGFFTPPSLRSVILGNAWGWALIYTLALLAAYIILTGRRFGRPIPLREEVARRSSAEYVESMADLFQRGGQQSFMLRHYYQSIKRRLARPYSINPRLDDPAFVAELARHRDIDADALLALLARLQQPHIQAAELVQLVAAADAALSASTSTPR